MALAVEDIPIAVISLTEQLFADRGAIDAMGVLPFVSGVQQQADGSPGQAGYSLRGFANVGLRGARSVRSPWETSTDGFRCGGAAVF